MWVSLALMPLTVTTQIMWQRRMCMKEISYTYKAWVYIINSKPSFIHIRVASILQLYFPLSSTQTTFFPILPSLGESTLVLVCFYSWRHNGSRCLVVVWSTDLGMHVVIISPNQIKTILLPFCAYQKEELIWVCLHILSKNNKELRHN